MYRVPNRLFLFGSAVAVLAGLCAGWANAGIIVLVDENFQSPMLANNTQNPSFAGWTYVDQNAIRSKTSTAQSDVPGDTDFATNQVLQLEWTGGLARYALDHAWSTDDVFTLTVNAAPQAWNIHQARWIRPRIRQNSDNVVLWDPGETAETKLYQGEVGQWVWNGPGPYGNSTWQAEPDTLYTFTINASDFTTGTPGQTIYLELAHSGQRGMYYDNVVFSVIPEPSSALLALLGLVGLLMMRRKR